MSVGRKWVDVVGYEGRYQVSSDGRVRTVGHSVVGSNGSTVAVRGHDKAVFINSCGYPSVTLNTSNRSRVRQVHRLMGEAFLGAGECDVVRHLNDIRTDNRLENLATGDASDNMRDCVANGHHYNATKTHCPEGAPVHW